MSQSAGSQLTRGSKYLQRNLHVESDAGWVVESGSSRTTKTLPPPRYIPRHAVAFAGDKRQKISLSRFLYFILSPVSHVPLLLRRLQADSLFFIFFLLSLSLFTHFSAPFAHSSSSSSSSCSDAWSCQNVLLTVALGWWLTSSVLFKCLLFSPFCFCSNARTLLTKANLSNHFSAFGIFIFLSSRMVDHQNN